MCPDTDKPQTTNAAWRTAIEKALGVGSDQGQHTPQWAAGRIDFIRTFSRQRDETIDSLRAEVAWLEEQREKRAARSGARHEESREIDATMEKLTAEAATLRQELEAERKAHALLRVAALRTLTVGYIGGGKMMCPPKFEEPLRELMALLRTTDTEIAKWRAMASPCPGPAKP